MITIGSIDADTQKATTAFLGRLAGRYSLADVVLYGSRARQTHRPDSDADLAVILRAPHERRFDTVRALSGIAFDVMLETGIRIQPVPLWEEEWLHPECFSNPELIENIRKDGVRL